MRFVSEKPQVKFIKELEIDAELFKRKDEGLKLEKLLEGVKEVKSLSEFFKDNADKKKGRA